jgi:hypothetical protein
MYIDTKKDINNIRLLKELFYSYNSKLVLNGTIQIIVDKNQNYDEILSFMPNQEFKIVDISTNIISKDILNNEFIDFDNLDKIKMITIVKIINN